MEQRTRAPWGFTLVEALVALALLAVLVALAAPSLTGLRQRQQLRGLAEGFWNSLVLARAEAMARQQRVAVCAQSAAGDCDATGPWQRGWLVFVDANRNGQREADEPLVQRQGALPAGVSLVGLPPSGGFVAKWLLLSAAVGTGQWWWAVVLVLGGLFTGGYVMLVLIRAMGSTARPVEPMKPVARSREAVALAMSLAAVLLGLVALGPLELPAIGSAGITTAAEAVQ